jgi:hypothetical protein
MHFKSIISQNIRAHDICLRKIMEVKNAQFLFMTICSLNKLFLHPHGR